MVVPLRSMALGVALAVLSCGAGAPPNAEVAVLADARFRLDGESAWTTVALPDSWRERRPSAGGVGWYEFDFAGPQDAGETWAVLLPSVNMNAEAFINGVRIGSGGSFDEPVAHNFNRPLLFAIPAPLLAEHNTLLVRLWAYPHAQAGLGPISVGPEAALAPVHERRTTLQLGLAQLATAIAWVTALFILALWIGTRFDTVYGWFALAILLWSVNSLNYWVRDLPVSHWTWERIIHPSLEGFAVALAIWAHRFLALRRPRVEVALGVFFVVAVGGSALAPVPVFYDVANALHAASLAIGAYAAFAVLVRYRRFSVWERSLYLGGGALGLAFGLHDLSLQLGWIAPSGVHLLAYLVPVILLGFGASLVVRFVASLDEAETLNRELEARVQQKTRELESHHEHLRALEQERTVARERERIMREMHDGLGGQLVSALALVESGGGSPEATAAALRTALADMRVVIDSLDPALADLPSLLGALRARVGPLLERSGLKLAWRVGDVPDGVRLGSERSLHLMRVLQEAIANAVRHAGASQLGVEARREGRVLQIEVHDDGCGFDPDSVREGRGLSNMRRRAEAIGAELSIAGSDDGTVVALRVPLQDAVSRPG